MLEAQLPVNDQILPRLLVGALALVVITGCTTTRPSSTETAPLSSLAPGEKRVLRLRLSEIRAGQPAVGKDQIAYKVGRFDGVVWPSGIPSRVNGKLVAGRWFSDDQKLFEDAAETNGQTARSGQDDKTIVDRKDARGRKARPGNPTPGTRHAYSVTFEGSASSNGKAVWPGNNREDLKTVIRGPDSKFYLTDGHHASVMFSTIKRGGNRGRRINEFTLYFVLDQDYTGLVDKNNNGSAMDEFWVAAANKNQVWLKILNTVDHRYDYLPGVKGSASRYQVHSVDLAKFKGALPARIKDKEFADDPYRGILYYCRGIGWDKPTEGDAKGLPFLEFYWAEEIQEGIREGRIELDLSNYDLTSLERYLEAVRAISEWMAHLPSGELIGTSGFTATQMGRLQLEKKKVEKALGELVDASKPKDGEPTKFLKPVDSDDPKAERLGPLPKPGKWAYAWANRHGSR